MVVNNNEFFNRKRKILKKKIDLKDKIDSLTRDQNTLSGKGDLSAALKLKDEKNQLLIELDRVEKELSNLEILKEFNYLQNEFWDNLSADDKSTFFHFNKEENIPIDSNINNTFDALTYDDSKVLSIGTSLSTPLSNSQSKHLIRKLFNNFEENRSNSVYISMCFIEFKDYYAPLLFIPVIIENYYDYKILRDFNKDIKYNVLLKTKLKEFNIDLPDFDESIGLFIYALKKMDEINFKSNIVISNCNLEKILIYEDFNLDNWESFLSKLNTFSNSKGCYLLSETIKINNDIAEKWDNLDLKLNEDNIVDNPEVLIKNLLSGGNSILYVSDNIDSIKNSLINSNMGSLILDLNVNTTFNSFNNQINEKLIKTFDGSIKMDGTNEKIKLKKFISILKNPFLNYNILPMEIEEKIDDYANQIKGPKIKTSIQNISDYSIDYFDKINNEILELINKSHEIDNFKQYFKGKSLDFTNYHLINRLLDNLECYIDEFISLNKLLNENLKIKIFNNLYFVRFLTNLNVLSKKYKYIDVEDRIILNEFIKDYNKDSNKFFIDVESLNDINSNLIDFKPKLLKFNENLEEIINFLDDIEYVSIENYQSLTECNIDINKTIRYLDDLNGYLNTLKTKTIDEVKNDVTNFENDYDKLYRKYFNSNDDIFEILENNVKYTELIDYKIIEDEFIIKNNLPSFFDKIEYFYQVYKNILKEINNIQNFYQKNNNIKISEELFSEHTTFNDLKSIISIIKKNLKLFNSLNSKNYDYFVIKYVNLYLDGLIEEEDISNMLYFNVYKSLFEKFFELYPVLSNKNLDYTYYEHKLNNLAKDIYESQYNNFLHEIYKIPRELTEMNKSAKKDLNQKIDNHYVDNIKFALIHYKDCIMSNKRIFILDFKSIFQYLDHTYENSFDYVIIDHKEASDFVLLSLLLRCKNKIINLNGVKL